MENNQISTQREFFVPLETLMEYEEFSLFVQSGHPDTFRITDFIQFLYHRDSPLSKKYEDLPARTSAAYQMADLDLNASYMQHLLSVGDSQVMIIDGNMVGDSKFLMQIDEMIACYLSRIQNNLKWEMYVTYQSLYWQYTKILRNPLSKGLDEDKAAKTMDIKTKITEPAFDLIKKIEQLRVDIFGENKRASDIAEQKVRKVSPETMAVKANMR